MYASDLNNFCKMYKLFQDCLIESKCLVSLRKQISNQIIFF